MNFSIGLLEVEGLVAAIEGLDAMEKAADVEVTSIERRLGGRLVTIVVRGNVSAVKAAIDAGIEAAEKLGSVKAHEIIARPHPEILKFIDQRDTVK